AMIALMTLLPHFYWQYEHDFASFQYHLSDRSKPFRVGYVFEYLGNIWGTLNPFLFPVFFIALYAQRFRDRFERTILVLSVFFLLFFGFSTLRGHVQPQWVLPSSLGVILCVVAYARKSERNYRYVRNMSVFTLSLFLFARLNLIFGWIQVPAMGFGYEAPMKEIRAVAGEMPVVMKSSYSNAALYSFYSGGEANSQQEWSHRNSQYGLWNLDEDWKGKSVVVESEEGDQQLILSNNKVFRYVVKQGYVPTHRVCVTPEGSTDFLLHGKDHSLSLSARVENPYPFALQFTPQGVGGLTIECLIYRKKELFYRKDIVATGFSLLPGETKLITFDTSFELDPGSYNLGFVVRDLPMTGWWANPKRVVIEVQEK
ncbi:MAG: hypothetical protein ACRC9Q_00420, partial [Bacteroidales bacterium]